MPVPRSRALAGGVLLASAATGAAVRTLRRRGEIPEHSETHLSVTCADGRYALGRAVEALRIGVRPRGLRVSTVFAQTPPGGGAGLLHPTFGPAVVEAVTLLRGVRPFELVDLRLHVGGPGGCGFLNAMAAGGAPMWLGGTGRDLSWADVDVTTAEGVLRIGELARDVLLAGVTGAPLQVRVRVEQFGRTAAGLPTVRTLLAA